MIPSLLQIPSAVSDSKLHSVLPNNGKGDFQFDRSTGATRINRDGLIEEVGYFSSELVQNGNFSELGSEIITNGDFSQNGVVNGTSASYARGWFSADSEINIVNNELVITNGVSFGGRAYATNGVDSISVVTSGKSYKLVYTITENTDNATVQYHTGSAYVNAPSTVGTHTIYYQAAGTIFILRNVTANTTVKIDNVSVKQVDPNDRWVLNPDWSFTNNGVSITNATGGYNDSALYQLITLDTSKTYKVNINVSSISGSIQVYTGSFGAGFSISTTGEKSFTLDLTSLGNRVNIVPNASTSAVITNFSIVEVQGDRPRLSYDITNGVVEDKPHLLLEPQSTNLLTFSEDFSGYVNQNTTDTANATTSPDGANNGTQLTNTTTSSNYIYKQVTLSTSTSYSISVFVKKGTSNIARLDTWDSTGSTQASIQINLDTEATSTITGTASFEKYPNDWYRLKVSFTSSGSLGTTYYRIFNDDGVNGSYIYVFGAMLEQQAYCTSYIPTAGTTITRAAETCNNSKPSVNSTEGVLYAEIAAIADDSTLKSVCISDGSTANRVIINYSNASNRLTVDVRVGGVGQAFMQTFSFTITDFLKIALKYKLNDFALYINGSEIATDTSGSVFSAGTLNTLSFDNGAGGEDFYGKVKGLAVYNEALSESQLMQLTGVTASSIYSNFVTRTASFTVEALNEVKKVIDNL